MAFLWAGMTIQCFIFVIEGGFENFHSNIDPEELFRKIFGQAGFNQYGPSSNQDFADSIFGHSASTEVTYIWNYFYIIKAFVWGYTNSSFLGFMF